jgi:putative endonuclease
MEYVAFRIGVAYLFYVYAIKSTKHNYIYVGMTANMNRRLAEHNSGKTRSNKHYAPFNIIYSEVCPDRMSARVREKYLKSGVGKEFLKNLV